MTVGRLAKAANAQVDEEAAKMESEHLEGERKRKVRVSVLLSYSILMFMFG
jgi:hypothetical protein